MGLFSNKGLQYQAHKDALEQAERLVRKYMASEDGMASVPVEFRRHMHDTIDTLQWHVENTMIPAQLGDRDLMEQLIPELTYAQMISTRQYSYETQRRSRVSAYNEFFKWLDHMVAGLSKREKSLGMTVRTLRDGFGPADEILGWFGTDPEPELSISPQQAARLVQQAKAILAK